MSISSAIQIINDIYAISLIVFIFTNGQQFVCKLVIIYCGKYVVILNLFVFVLFCTFIWDMPYARSYSPHLDGWLISK